MTPGTPGCVKDDEHISFFLWQPGRRLPAKLHPQTVLLVGQRWLQQIVKTKTTRQGDNFIKIKVNRK